MEPKIYTLGDWAGTITDLCELTNISKHTAYQRLNKYIAGECSAEYVLRPRYQGRGKNTKTPTPCNATAEFRSLSLHGGNEKLCRIPVGKFDNI